MTVDITWWESLKHDGMVIAPAPLAELFSDPFAPLPVWLVDRLRAAVSRVLDGGDEGDVGSLIDLVLERILGLESHQWQKGGNVPADWTRRALTGEALRPNRVWRGPPGAELAVFVTSDARLRVGRGKLSYARMVEWLRQTGRSFGILTNGRQWWLVHAGAEHDANCQWDIGLWFQDGHPSGQVEALLRLLGKGAFQPHGDKPGTLASAILASRSSQGDLSTALGERVRQAVEELVRGASGGLRDIPEGLTKRHLYVAATRIVMRMVVVLFAEARELLPTTHLVYDQSYSLGGLLTELDRRAGGRARERLRHQHLAWPRLRGLFQLVFAGSSHPGLPVPAYGGGLFAPGRLDAADPVDRAVALFEGASPPDSVIHAILEKLTRTEVRIRKGRQSTRVAIAVNFKTLSSEYIGILYEGLLDYELQQAKEPTVFLNVGPQQFALPFDRLAAMTEADMRVLLEALKKDTKTDSEGGDEAGPAEDADSPGSEEVEGPDGVPDPAAVDGDKDRLFREMVEAWAEKAAYAAGLLKRRGSRAPVLVKKEIEQAVSRLIGRRLLPGDWYLVRWGGTRKGAGTFYTRPQLASPTVRRALDPLLYDGVGDTPVPKSPEAILAIKLCDPAMGSASFLVSALRQVTDALYKSLLHHERIASSATGAVVRLADGLPLDSPAQETLPVPPDHEDFEERVKARLRRHVVERCLYGTDFDPLAVELGRLALWVETMDRSLPFSFLDHKLKCGNALVGAWLDQFADYPLRAWDREGGDGDHERFVHHHHDVKLARGSKKGQVVRQGDVWSAALKQKRDEAREQMADLLGLPLLRTVTDAGAAVKALRRQLTALHGFSVHESAEQARQYREKFLGSQAYEDVKARLDLWCALWFWPGERLGDAPLPRTFVEPSADTLAVARSVAADRRFFHWELEFPDVFAPDRGGFDAIVGNPPWETSKPNSKEFFSDVDPLFRTYGKQDAIARQKGYFERDAKVEQRWIAYMAGFKAMANWVTWVARPFGDNENGEGVRLGGKKSEELHAAWRKRRAGRVGYADPAHPFRHQGSADLNTYKMFLEVGHALLKTDGRLGIIVPSGVYSDLGAVNLRRLFVEKCRWERLYVLQNEKFVFANVHHAFKLSILVLVKGGETIDIKTRFRLGPGDSPTTEELENDVPHDAAYLALPVERVKKFSSQSLSILEIRSSNDLRVIDRLYDTGVVYGDAHEGWDVEYMREFHSSDDASSFPARARWERDGYRPDIYGNWLNGAWCEAPSEGVGVLGADGQWIGLEDVTGVAVPLYQGVMIGLFSAASALYESGGGSRAVWREADDPGNQRVLPQFLMGLDTLRLPGSRWIKCRKVLVRDISGTTNSRTTIAVTVDGSPTSDTLKNCFPRNPRNGAQLDCLGAILGSLAFDFQVRVRMVGSHLSQFVMNDTAVISPTRAAPFADAISRFAFRLRARGPASAREWLTFGFDESRAWQGYWAITRHERLRLRCILDAAIASLYDLTDEDFRWILRDCDHPLPNSTSEEFTRGLDPKGFWRVDKTEQPELRHTVLAQVAFRALAEAGGLAPFLALNGGDGWQFPETIRLHDHDLGHDERSKEAQPLTAALGPRLLPTQTEPDPAASWAECRRHAHILERLLGPKADDPDRQTPTGPPAGPPSPTGAEEAAPAPANEKSPALLPDHVAPRAEQVPLFGRR